jgi:hypothetical protein
LAIVIGFRLQALRSKTGARRKARRREGRRA